MCQSVVDYRITVVYSGNSVGKDYWVGGLVPWWLYTRSDSLVVVTGPSQTTLGTITWKEIRLALADPLVRLPGFVSRGTKNSPQVVAVDPSRGWQALGYSTTNIERASGQHNKKLMVVVEEASGVEDQIWEAIDSLGYTRLVAIGNPIRPDGRFVDLIHQAEKDKQANVPPHLAVNAIRIPSTDSPDAAKDKSDIGLADATWINDCFRRYGRDSLWCRTHVFAEIPRIAADNLIPPEWLDWASAQSRPSVPLNHPINNTRRISCDLGEGVGRDSTAILVRDDWGILEITFGASLGLAEAATKIHSLAHKYNVPQDRISYDRIGIGRELHLHLSRLGFRNCIGYAGAASPISDEFTNLRTEAAFKLRDRLNPEGSTDWREPNASRRPFVIPPGPYWDRLREELRTLTYELYGRKTKLLPKDKHVELLGHSPDLSDALIQSFAY